MAGVVAIVVAAVIGRSTFDEWQRQRLGDRKIVVAERVQTLAYRLAEAFEQIRSPVSFAGENEAAQTSLLASGIINGDTPLELNSRLAILQITLQRISARNELWRELSEVIPIAMTLFESGVAEQLNVLRELRGQIAGAITGLASIAHDRMRPQREAQATRMDERQQRYEDIIWQGAPGDDAFGNAVSAAVASIETLMRPTLREGRNE